ncbi:lytic transglycosylase domain-containing protein [Zemynaea arenosa]|uniref:lytic transglycosylase domain-containing protein n=1 Tax=Zemynaea arenosa TaxID=2561931 RepID=UPI0027D9613B|nr:lytic transglycosylase domain-containing protein [Massilia arenosa]
MASLRFLSRCLAGALLASGGLAVQAQVPPPPVPQGTIADQQRVNDEIFLQLRDAARADDPLRATELAARLPSYEIPSYVDYYRLKPRLRDASDDEIRAVLQRWDGSAIADRLRNDWLLQLGRKRDWTNFDQQYPLFVLQDDTQVKCYWLLSRAVKGIRVADEARALLVNPTYYGEACATLIATLYQAKQFNTDDLLTQLRLAGEFDATGPARRTALLLGASDTRAAQAVDLPAIAMARGIGKTRAEHEIYLVAIGRMARTSLKLATIALKKNEPKLTAQERAIGWAAIAHPASLQMAPEAAEYWRKAAGAPLSADQLQWKTRIALKRGEWKTVATTIQAMPAALRNEPTWTYWLARALQAEFGHDNPEALALYRKIADQTNFYGQLAIEELGQPITLPPQARTPTPDELAAMARNPGFQRSLKFFALRLRFEGTREWNWELRKMNERELLAAGEYARQNQVLDRMVYTAEKTKSEVDYSQRFPSPHEDILAPTTQALGLDLAWVYGLIRQESRFVSDARSSVGASGLMQVMPSTGKYVAGKIGLEDYGHDKLGELKTNLVLGSNYLDMIYEKFNRSEVLATAAYNAGPGRINGWRDKMDRSMEGAVFAETIPFPETRNYVKNVLANTTNYAALFEKKPQSLKARLGTVTPAGARSE